MVIRKCPVRFSSWFDKSSLLIESDDLRIRSHKDSDECFVEPFLFLNAGPRLKTTFNEYTKLAPPALIIEAENITLIGHGLIVDSKGRRIAEHSSVTEVGRLELPFNQKLLVDGANECQLIPEINVRVIEEDVAILSQAGQGVYGHWLVDILPRIAFMESVGFRGKYVLYNQLFPFAKQLLTMFGISLERLITYNPRLEALYFSKALIPGSLRYKGAFSKAALLAVERLSSQAVMPGVNKIYISRAGLNERNQTITNRVELEAIASSYGFEIVRPEGLSIADQASLFATASILAGEYGSGMHNSIFCHPTCKILTFQSKSTPLFVQAGLSNLISQPIGFVFGSPEGRGRVFSIDSKDAEYAFNQVTSGDASFH